MNCIDLPLTSFDLLYLVKLVTQTTFSTEATEPLVGLVLGLCDGPAVDSSGVVVNIMEPNEGDAVLIVRKLPHKNRL